ncbi:MAG: hypothetical protein Q8L82_02630 [Nitrosomonas sp.]|nr:hypothetical protein [Nitrosomonas sp.]
MMISLANGTFGQLLRSFPIDSKLGKLTTFAYPEVVIDGQALHLGAGGQIRDKNNFIILPAMLNEKGSVRYQMDPMGNVHRIWFLTPEEADLAKIEEKAKKTLNKNR